MKRFWPVAASLVVLVAAVWFLITKGGDSNSPDEAVLASTATPEATATPLSLTTTQVPGGGPPVMMPLPRGTIIDPQSIHNQNVFIDTTRQQYLSQAEELIALLLVIDGDRTYCGNLCPLTATPTEVIDGLIYQCGRVVLGAIRWHFSNFPEITSTIDLYADGCDRLKAASDRLGQPVDTAAWRDVRAELVQRMQTAVTSGKAQPTLAPTPAGSTPSPLRSAGAYYPEGTLTGIPSVDKFLRVMDAGDLTPLAVDAVFTNRPCDSSISGPGALHCPPGVPEGGLVSLLPFSSCSPNWVLDRDQLRERLGQRPGLHLYAVYEGGSYGFYGVAIVTPQSVDHAFAYYLDEQGRLTAFIACGGPRGQNPDAKLLFPPRGG